MTPSRQRRSCQAEAIDIALAPIWYATPKNLQRSFRRCLLAMARWRDIVVPYAVRARADRVARRTGLVRRTWKTRPDPKGRAR